MIGILTIMISSNFLGPLVRFPCGEQLVQLDFCQDFKRLVTELLFTFLEVVFFKKNKFLIIVLSTVFCTLSTETHKTVK